MGKVVLALVAAMFAVVYGIGLISSSSEEDVGARPESKQSEPGQDPPAGEKLSVHVGTFANQEAATAAQHQLAENGFSSQMLTGTDASGKTWRFLAVGAFLDYESAKAAEKDIHAILQWRQTSPMAVEQEKNPSKR